ncbi:hypothetical protein BDK51DRAFT_45238 [Blyttiomyces helicus]|uniref:SH3 domain-containing protein n=1 Tax=Blyttiomyces helicus TaxID=388810 RepID=A0A4P9W5F8_9FUNG|nr:hypothetical protein BDK51DRAFT_45238 [Blyttiomyces helicus]|eukprot:RKO87641.1 hypothetical protein BDK51DRAFT_45238 [Blyttiomyces helicus]
MYISNHQVYLTGGNLAPLFTSTVNPQSTVTIYTPETNTWVSGSPLAIGFASARSTVMASSGLAVAYGGLVCPPGLSPCTRANANYSDRVLVAQPGNGSAMEQINVGGMAPVGREGACVVAVRNSIYMYGGSASDTTDPGAVQTSLNDMYMFDTTSSPLTWVNLTSTARVSSNHYPSIPWSWVTCAAIGDVIYLLGQPANSTAAYYSGVSMIHAYNTQTNTWFDPMNLFLPTPPPTSGPSAGLIVGVLFLVLLILLGGAIAFALYHRRTHPTTKMAHRIDKLLPHIPFLAAPPAAFMGHNRRSLDPPLLPPLSPTRPRSFVPPMPSRRPASRLTMLPLPSPRSPQPVAEVASPPPPTPEPEYPLEAVLQDAAGDQGLEAGDWAVVAHVYEAREDDEVSLEVGEMVQVLQVFPDGWGIVKPEARWRGMCPLADVGGFCWRNPDAEGLNGNRSLMLDSVRILLVENRSIPCRERDGCPVPIAAFPAWKTIADSELAP